MNRAVFLLACAHPITKTKNTGVKLPSANQIKQFACPSPDSFMFDQVRDLNVRKIQRSLKVVAADVRIRDVTIGRAEVMRAALDVDYGKEISFVFRDEKGKLVDMHGEYLKNRFKGVILRQLLSLTPLDLT